MFYVSALFFLLLQPVSSMASIDCADALLGRFAADNDKWLQLDRLRAELKASLADCPEWQEVHWDAKTEEPRRPQDLVGKEVRGARWDKEEKQLHSFHAKVVQLETNGIFLQARLYEERSGTQFLIPLEIFLSAGLHVKDQTPLDTIPQGRIPYNSHPPRVEAMKAELVAALGGDASWKEIEWDSATDVPKKPLDLTGKEVRGVRVDKANNEIHLFHAKITSILDPWNFPKALLTEVGTGLEFSIPLDRVLNSDLRVRQSP